MRSVSILRIATLSLALAAPFAALAKDAPVAPVDELQVQHQMGFSTGNDPSKGRYYDEGDRYLDPQTGYRDLSAPGLDINYGS